MGIGLYNLLVKYITSGNARKRYTSSIGIYENSANFCVNDFGRWIEKDLE